MEVHIWLTYVTTVLILVYTPGPSVLLATANSMKFGLKKGSGTILGDLSANICQITLAAAGLATVVVTSGYLFQVLKWMGVAYIVYMGIQKFKTNKGIQLQTSSAEDRSFFKLYTEGFLMSAANPKAIIFFAALFPLFIDPKQAFLPQVIILALTFLVLDGSALLTYSILGNKLKNYLENQSKMHILNRIIGSMLILSGFLLALVKKN